MKKVPINKRYITEVVDEEIVLFDTEKSVLITLNETATLMFQEMQKGKTKEQVAEKVIKTYKTTTEQALKDYSRLLKDLKKKKVLM